MTYLVLGGLFWCLGFGWIFRFRRCSVVWVFWFGWVSGWGGLPFGVIWGLCLVWVGDFGLWDVAYFWALGV